MKLLKSLVATILFLSTFVYADTKNELLFYVGITMVKPVNELAKNFEKANNCTIKILQGGSQDLYDSIKSSQVGDLYLPGSVSYRDKFLKDGLLLDGKFYYSTTFSSHNKQDSKKRGLFVSDVLEISFNKNNPINKCRKYKTD
jgi:ABC-type molybdate transport system substrate-binding protein